MKSYRRFIFSRILDMHWKFKLYIHLGLLQALAYSLDKANLTDGDKHFGEIFGQIGDPISTYFRPNYSGPPVVIWLDFTVQSIGEISSIRKTVQLTIYLRQSWKDNRYIHTFEDKITPSLGDAGHPNNYIWVPDTTLVNTKSSKRHTKNDKLDISNDGNIFWSTMVTLEAKCDMDFHDFPIDTQTCTFGFESYGYDRRHVIYKWYGKHIDFTSTEAEQFMLKNYTTTGGIENYVAGNFVVLKAYFTFERQLQVTVLQIFFPAGLVVVVSWLTFWMHKRSPSARIGLGTTTLLTLTMIWLSAIKKIPEVSYVKAIDIYFMISFCFILGVLFEYVVVTNNNFVEWKGKREEKEMQRRKKKISCNSTTMMEMKVLKEQSLEIAKRSNSSLSFTRRYDKYGVRTNMATSSTYQEYIDEGFDINESESNSSATESDCSDDDLTTNKNSIFLDKRIISMFLDTQPATLDIVCRFLFPFCYFCFAAWWWLHYMGKRSQENQDLMETER